MIIITRKIAEKVCVGDDIEVTVLDVIDRSVRLGFHAPLSMGVLREEMFNKNRVCGCQQSEPFSE